jgi:hypothetical protein
VKALVDISEEFAELIGRNSELEPAAYAQTVLDKEAKRLFHVERSKPKTREAKPIGRPSISPRQKKVKELAELLRGVYQKKKEFYGVEYEGLYKAQETALEEAIAEESLEKLQLFIDTQPWVLRKWDRYARNKEATEPG